MSARRAQEKKKRKPPWSPTSWQDKVAHQDVVYPDGDELARVVDSMARLPPLVTSWEVESLKEQLAQAARGELFLLQGGDCAESFDQCRPDSITATLKILMQMSLVLVHAARRNVIRVGRIAGQYAKPRSAETETRGDLTLPSYRGDLVNRSGFTRDERTPDPWLMLRGYERAALTLNFIRALAEHGFADLHHPENWDLSFVRNPSVAEEYQAIADSVRESLEFMEALSGTPLSALESTQFFTSHEGLSLHYEAAQTRTVPRRDGFYNLSTHLPWIGMRTAQIDGAHVEFFRGIENPIAVKVGPKMTPEWLRELLAILHPDDEPGRLTLIHRMGSSLIEERLPPLIEEVARSGKRVTFVADPMHGNTERTERGYKTRRFAKILLETERAFEIHERMGTVLGGVHVELTGDDVTECVGGARGLSETDLERAYRSPVDPRLNYEQALELSMLIAQHMRRIRQRQSQTRSRPSRRRKR